MAVLIKCFKFINIPVLKFIFNVLNVVFLIRKTEFGTLNSQLRVQSKQQKHYKKVWNMFNINNKDTTQYYWGPYVVFVVI